MYLIQFLEVKGTVALKVGTDEEHLPLKGAWVGLAAGILWTVMFLRFKRRMHPLEAPRVSRGSTDPRE